MAHVLNAASRLSMRVAVLFAGIVGIVSAGDNFRYSKL